MGLGSSIVPRRSLNLTSKWVDTEGLSLTHDLDLFALSNFSPIADFTLGRQAITRGASSLFSVADVWTQFSPYKLDTSQKRWVDGIRALGCPFEDGEIDLVVVDRGGLEKGNFKRLSRGAKLGGQGQ